MRPQRRRAPLGARHGGVAQQHLHGKDAPAAAHAAGDVHLHGVPSRPGGKTRQRTRTRPARTRGACERARRAGRCGARGRACDTRRGEGRPSRKPSALAGRAEAHQLAAVRHERDNLEHLEQQPLRQARPVRVGRRGVRRACAEHCVRAHAGGGARWRQPGAAKRAPSCETAAAGARGVASRAARRRGTPANTTACPKRQACAEPARTRAQPLRVLAHVLVRVPARAAADHQLLLVRRRAHGCKKRSPPRVLSPQAAASAATPHGRRAELWRAGRCACTQRQRSGAAIFGRAPLD